MIAVTQLLGVTVMTARYADPHGRDPYGPEAEARDAARREAEERQSRQVHDSRGGRVDDGAVDSTGRRVTNPRRGTQFDEDV
ncbi:hypothetical protein ACQEVZ_60080 [Dactylosporangium sp. CA-152071]|uniref:hypothetical protein n=1 Tax=Dactylosporangium sp. CA-152071 TaxID=3239933 RepID=UPI003D950727